MDVPPLFWVTCGQATRIRRTHTKKQVKATKRRRALESMIEDHRLAKELNMSFEEFQARTGACPTTEDVI